MQRCLMTPTICGPSGLYVLRRAQAGECLVAPNTFATHRPKSSRTPAVHRVCVDMDFLQIFLNYENVPFF